MGVNMGMLQKKNAQPVAPKKISIVELIIVILISILISYSIVGCQAKKNSETAPENVKMLNKYPAFGRPLVFDLKTEELWKKADTIMRNIDDISNLTDEDIRFFKQINYDYEDEMKPDYYGTEGGGCSWYCGGGPNDVSASSYLISKSATIDYLPGNAHDFSLKTAWVEGVPGYGIGEYLEYSFPPMSPRVTTIIIANGYVKSKKTYYENSRVKRLKMYTDNKPVAVLNLKDTLCEQHFEFEPIGEFNSEIKMEDLEKLPKRTMKFEILDVYKGDKYDETAISEIYFSGVDVHCFGKGTKILMADNSLKNIESIQENDVVKSYDFENKRLTNSKVSKLISVTHSDLLKLKFVDNEIITTSDHPFRIKRSVWAAVNPEKSNKNYIHKAPVEKLKIDDKVFCPDENNFSKIIDIVKIAESQMTYTIELFENDNFIANGLSVKTETVIGTGTL